MCKRCFRLPDGGSHVPRGGGRARRSAPANSAGSPCKVSGGGAEAALYGSGAAAGRCRHRSLWFSPPGGKNLTPVSPRRVRGKASFSGRKCGIRLPAAVKSYAQPAIAPIRIHGKAADAGGSPPKRKIIFPGDMRAGKRLLAKCRSPGEAGTRPPEQSACHRLSALRPLRRGFSGSPL